MATAPNYCPQFDSPFRLGSDGQPVTVEQFTAEDYGAQVYNVLVCPQGAKLGDPDFGIPWPVFDLLNLDVQAIADAVQRLVPDASIDVVQEQLERVAQLQPVQVDVTAQVESGS